MLQVNDDSALSQSAKDALYKSYPDARRAHLKSGGNFPYLSRSDEVNLYIQVCCALISNVCFLQGIWSKTDAVTLASLNVVAVVCAQPALLSFVAL